jgi:hypothetical protein
VLPASASAAALPDDPPHAENDSKRIPAAAKRSVFNDIRRGPRMTQINS